MAEETLAVENRVTVHDLIQMANDAISKMSNKNSHKRLVYMLGVAVSSLADRVSSLETELKGVKDEKPKIYLP